MSYTLKGYHGLQVESVPEIGIVANYMYYMKLYVLYEIKKV